MIPVIITQWKADTEHETQAQTALESVFISFAQDTTIFLVTLWVLYHKSQKKNKLYTKKKLQEQSVKIK